MKENKRAKGWLRLIFVLGVAAVLLFAIATVLVLQYVFIKTQILTEKEIIKSPAAWIILFIGTSSIMGLSLTPLFSRLILKPINKLVDGLSKLADGDYSTRIYLGKVKELKTLEESFNELASELQSVEILRSDFVNDFSHELKTPIVSISGLISLLKNGNLSKAKQRQYLDVIDEEVKRLTNMTTNVLNFNKLEKQSILTDKTRFNLSEQIRNCILLLEDKWTAKNLELCLDFDEFIICGNEDMLKQVWVNLIDNAVKFSYNGAPLAITAFKDDDRTLKITVENSGKEIEESDYEKIFTKFYQCDKTHSADGNGIGLSIVKHVVELHDGSVSVNSADGKTMFTVRLPIEDDKES